MSGSRVSERHTKKCRLLSKEKRQGKVWKVCFCQKVRQIVINVFLIDKEISFNPSSKTGLVKSYLFVVYFHRVKVAVFVLFPQRLLN